MIPGMLNFVTGGQFGSEGKGKVVGYLCKKYPIAVSICSFSSQAGHTVDNGGTKYVFKQLPVATVSPETILLVSQGAIIDLDNLRQEIDTHKVTEKRLTIHPRAVVIDQRHKELEMQDSDGPGRIASTQKGNGAAMADFVLRNRNLRLMQDVPEFKSFLGDTRGILNSALDHGAVCLAECAQGYSLDLYQGFYPHVTSRGCTPAAELSRIGVSQQRVGRVYGCYRTYPIRVGNIEKDGKQFGYSGDGFEDQKEVTWEDITKWSGSEKPLLERTTVTNRIRRVFDFSVLQFLESVSVTGVTDVCITFTDYINAKDYGVTEFNNLSSETIKWIEDLRLRFDDIFAIMHPRLSMLSTGPKNDDTVDFDAAPMARVGGSFWTKY
jgi:adenylosuccinate synthase